MKVVYLASGFPTPDNPSHGIFNKVAVEALCKSNDITLIHYRIYKPGRRLFSLSENSGYRYLTLCVPFIPLMQNRFYWLNHKIFRFFTKWYAKRFLSEANIVHASDGNLGIMISKLKSIYQFKLLVQLIGGDLNQDMKVQHRRIVSKHIPDLFDKVSVNSKSLQRAFSEMFPGLTKPEVIYRGVDLEKFTPAPSGDNKKGIRFYYLGGLPDYKTFSHGRNTKGGITLMNAWNKLERQEDRGLELFFAGPDSDSALAETWRDKLKFPERVTLGGKIEPSLIPEIHQRYDVCIIPSLEEGLPNVAMEASASGNPVIGTEVGGIPEVISNGETGILIDTDNPDKLSTTLWELGNKPDIIPEMGKSGRARMENFFNRSQFAESYTRLYQEMFRNNL